MNKCDEGIWDRVIDAGAGDDSDHDRAYHVEKDFPKYIIPFWDLAQAFITNFLWISRNICP